MKEAGGIINGWCSNFNHYVQYMIENRNTAKYSLVESCGICKAHLPKKEEFKKQPKFKIASIKKCKTHTHTNTQRQRGKVGMDTHLLNIYRKGVVAQDSDHK